MLIAHQTFQAKYGRGDELVAIMQEMNRRLQGDEAEGKNVLKFRILTDASGPFFTVITEVEVKNFADWEVRFSEAMSSPWMGELFGRMMPLVESGRRDFYHLVE